MEPFIIESAFFNAVGNLIHYRGRPNEDTVRAGLMSHILRNDPALEINLSCDYRSDCKAKVDLLVRSSFSGSWSPMTQYGQKDKNYIEVKFDRKTSKASEQEIARDMLRLCIHPEELRGSIRENARFFLLIATKDKWRSRFKAGASKVKFDIKEVSPWQKLNLQVYTLKIEPVLKDSLRTKYYALLTRIQGFSVISNGRTLLRFSDHDKRKWGAAREQQWASMTKQLVGQGRKKR